MRGLPQLPNFQAKTQVLEIHKCEKAFQGISQRGVSQGPSLTRIYFSNNRIKYRQGEGEEKKREKYFLFPMQEMGAKF
jgi:hypothetical protein